MFHRLILKVTKFQLPPRKRLSTVVKNIMGGHHGPPCQIGLRLTSTLSQFPPKNILESLGTDHYFSTRGSHFGEKIVCIQKINEKKRNLLNTIICSVCVTDVNQ